MPTLCLVLTLATPLAHANPVGPQVRAGAASFAGAGSTLTVTNSPGTVIDWRAFSIAGDEHTRFAQSGADSAVLNRVTGGAPSAILGRLSSNGQVFLVNRQGIVFGRDAVVDTAGMVASSLDISDEDFRAGRLRFAGGGDGVVRNEGRIEADGDVYLVGPQVENAGLIRSTGGSVLLAAGRAVTITSPDAHGVEFEMQAPGDTVLNLGTIEARNAAAMFAGTLRHTGAIRAARAELDQHGHVVLAAAHRAEVSGNARIDVDNSVGRGGQVAITGTRIEIADSASISARGAGGGGEILVGGDLQGANPAVRNARMTTLATEATLDASATSAGDGGKVVVWSDERTAAAGRIAARGGSTGGNGGLVEVSSRQNLEYSAAVDTSAPQGRTGTLLLDPANVNVTTSSDALNGGGFSGGTFSGTTGTATLTWATIDLELASNNVVITTSGSGGAGNISIQNGFALNRDNHLSFLAHNDFSSVGISNTGAGSFTAVAGWDGDLMTPGTLANTGAIGVSGGLQFAGSIELAAGAGIGLFTNNNGGNFLHSTGADVILTAGTNVDLNTNCCGGGTDTLRAAAALDITAGSGHIIQGRTVNLAGGNITLNAGTNIGHVAAGASFGTLTATAAGGDITLTAGTGGTGAIRLDSAPVTANDAITLSAPGDIRLDNTFAYTATNGSITLTSTAGAIFQAVSCCGSFTARGDITINAVNGVGLSNLTAGNAGDGRLSVTNTGATSDVNLGGTLRATKAGLAANQYAITLNSARDVLIGSTNTDAHTNVFGTLASGGIRIDAAVNVDLNTNCCGGGTSTYSTSGNFDVTAGSGHIVQGRAVRLSGGSLSLAAGSHIGNVAAGASFGTLTATAAGGDITLTAGTGGAGAIRLDSAPVTANDAITLSAPGDIRLDNTFAYTATNGSITLTSTAGAIFQAVSCCGSFTARGDITINAVNGVGLSNLTAGNGGDGRLSVTSTGATSDLNLGGALRATKAGLAANQYAIALSSARDIFISSTNTDAHTNVFGTLASGGIRIDAATNVDLNTNCCGGGTSAYTTAGNFDITAGTGHIIQSRSVKLSGGNLNLNAGTHIGNVAAGGSFGTLTATAAGGDITLTAGTGGAGAVRIDGNAVTANDALTITAPGRIDPRGTTLTAINGALTLRSTGADVVQTACCASLFAGGDLVIDAVTGIAITTLTAGTGGNGRLLLTSTGATGDIGIGPTVRATNAGLTSGQFGIDIQSGRNVAYFAGNATSNTLFRTFISGGIRIRAAQDINLNSNCCGGGADTITAIGDLVVLAGLSGPGNIVNTAGNKTNLAGDSVYVSAVTSFATGNTITAPNTLSLELTGADLGIGLLTAQHVILSAPSGAILDLNGAANNVAATSLTTTSATGLSLDTSVDTLTIDNTGNGAVAVREVNDATVAALGAAGGSVTLSSASGTLISTGTLEMPDGGLVTGGFINQGALDVGSGTADFGSGIFTLASGTLTVAGGATLSKAGGSFAWDGGDLAGTGNYSLPQVNASGAQARILNGPTLTTPRLDLTGGSLAVQAGVLTATVEVNVAAGTLLDLAGGTLTTGTLNLDGHLAMTGNALGVTTLDIRAMGLLTGTGTITGDVVNGGTLAVGASPGMLAIAGQYLQSAAGRLVMELGGNLPGTGYDLLAITGQASLDGTLEVSLTGGFVPGDGAVFDLLTATLVSGDFAAFDLPTNGQTFAPGAGATFYRIAVTGAPTVPPPVVPPPELPPGGGVPPVADDAFRPLILATNNNVVLNERVFGLRDERDERDERAADEPTADVTPDTRTGEMICR